MARTMTGAEIVLKALADQGVEHIFGYPGGAVLPIYDEIFQQEKVKHILVRQEGGAVHAAEGYARSTGKVGVVLVTSGPGATNAVTGLTDALMDSIPLVVLTGQVPTHLIGNDAFQECDTVGITRPCTKHNWLVKNVNDLARILHEAFTKSGCYDAATLAPIWQADWFSLKSDLRWTPDFIDTARINRQGFNSDWALAFYHAGKLLRRYDSQHLLTTLNQRRFFDFTPSDWHFVWYDRFEIVKNQLVLSTARRRLPLWFFALDLGVQETYTFDLSSGAVIERVTTGVRRMWLYGVSGLSVFILMLLGLYFHRRSRRERTTPLEREA